MSSTGPQDLPTHSPGKHLPFPHRRPSDHTLGTPAPWYSNRPLCACPSRLLPGACNPSARHINPLGLCHRPPVQRAGHMLSRVAGGSRALGAALRALAALQAQLAGGLPVALASPPYPSSYDLSRLPPWQRRGGRWLSTAEPAAAPAAAAQEGEELHTVEYRVVVVTGDVRGAGSAAPAVIVLIGEGERVGHICASGSQWGRGAAGLDGGSRPRRRLQPASRRRRHPGWRQRLREQAAARVCCADCPPRRWPRRRREHPVCDWRRRGRGRQRRHWV